MMKVGSAALVGMTPGEGGGGEDIGSTGKAERPYRVLREHRKASRRERKQILRCAQDDGRGSMEDNGRWRSCRGTIYRALTPCPDLHRACAQNPLRLCASASIVLCPPRLGVADQPARGRPGVGCYCTFRPLFDSAPVRPKQTSRSHPALRWGEAGRLCVQGVSRPALTPTLPVRP